MELEFDLLLKLGLSIQPLILFGFASLEDLQNQRLGIDY